MSIVMDARTEQAELDALGEQICAGAGHLAAATGVWLGQVEEFDRRGGWAVDGVLSCAHWLSWKCGIGPGTAREHVRVARSLAQYHLIRTELCAGRLSYSKVRAITRAVTAATEDYLVTIALSCTGAQLETLIIGLRKAQNLDEVNARHEARSLSHSWAEDGSLLLRARLSPDEGAIVLAALDAARAATEPPPPPPSAAPAANGAGVPAGPPFGAGAVSAAHARRKLGQANADALVAMAETLLASGPAPAPGGERYQVSLHIDLDDLLAQHAVRQSGQHLTHRHPKRRPSQTKRGHTERGHTEHGHTEHGHTEHWHTEHWHTEHWHTEHGHGPGRLQDGPQLHPATALRLTCDSAATVIAHHRAGKRGTSMDVGRRTRVIPIRLRRALFLRDHGCRFPACTQTKFVDAHHVRHWTRGGPTALHNLVLLCRRHHRLLHEGGYGLHTVGQGAFTFTRPDGSDIPDVPVTAGGEPAAVQTLHGAAITPGTATPDWNGDKLQLDYTVQLLRLVETATITSRPADPRLN